MRKWNAELESLRASQTAARLSRPNTTSDSQFTFLKGASMQNPYAEMEGDDDDETLAGDGGYSEFSVSRNASSTSLRSRSTTGGSGGPVMPINSQRPSRFPMPDPGSLPPINTRLPPGAPSPMEREGASYFSPVESASYTPISASTRSSSQSTYSYGRYGTPSNGWSQPEEVNNRNTAPAMSRSVKDGGNPYLQNARGQRPSLPPSVQSAQQVGIGINRMRSASSPDIHNNPAVRRYPNGQVVPDGGNVPNVPPIPPNVAGRVAPINRSQSNSPANGLPVRTMTQSPGAPPTYGLPPRPNIMTAKTFDQSYVSQMDARAMTPNGFTTPMPPVSASSDGGQEQFMPSQLKAKVLFDNNYITLVIASNIQFRSLTDRIDAKLARLTNHSIGGGTVRLRYRDEDGDFVWIDSDEAVQDAFLDWRETHADKLAAGQVGEILLFCQSMDGEPMTNP